jgi:hypothetical protein
VSLNMDDPEAKRIYEAVEALRRPSDTQKSLVSPPT